MYQNTDAGKKRRGQFPCQKSAHGQSRGGGFPLGEKYLPDHQGGAHPGKLFQQLGGGRNRRLIPGVVIRADAGVDYPERNTEGDQLKQGDTAAVHGKELCQPACLPVKKKSDDQRKSQGKRKTGQEAGFRLPGTSGGPGSGTAPGDGGLHTGNHQREAETIYGKNHLIDSHSFGTNGMGEEYPIKEACNAAYKSGQSQNGSAGDESIF